MHTLSGERTRWRTKDSCDYVSDSIKYFACPFNSVRICGESTLYLRSLIVYVRFCSYALYNHQLFKYHSDGL